MKTLVTIAALSLSVATAAPAHAGQRTVEVEVTNLTQAIWFTPLLFAAHDRDLRLFQVGTAASGSLQAMAEGGDLTGLINDLMAASGDFVDNPASGLLAPGQSASAELPVDHDNRFLSITAMLLPTNDGFVGLDALAIPRRPGTYTYYLNGYDAGTEANDELITGGGAPGVAGIPGDPSGLGGTGGDGVAMMEVNPMVHIHRGVLGDLDESGGPSDLNAAYHRWLNPVAKLTLTVHPHRLR